MTIEYEKVQVRCSEMQTQVVEVPHWETPVLQAIYGEEDAVVIGTVEVDRKPPDPQDEFARLANRYGPKNKETPVVAAVYGSFGPGVAALARVINNDAPAEEPQPVADGLSDAEVDAIASAGDEKQAQVVGDSIDDLLDNPAD